MIAKLVFKEIGDPAYANDEVVQAVFFIALLRSLERDDLLLHLMEGIYEAKKEATAKAKQEKKETPPTVS